VNWTERYPDPGPEPPQPAQLADDEEPTSEWGLIAIEWATWVRAQRRHEAAKAFDSFLASSPDGLLARLVSILVVEYMDPIEDYREKLSEQEKDHDLLKMLVTARERLSK
jgi:hypothetical protein